MKTQEKKLKLAPVKTQEKTLNSGKDAEVGTLKRLLSQKNSYKECHFIETAFGALPRVLPAAVGELIPHYALPDGKQQQALHQFGSCAF